MKIFKNNKEEILNVSLVDADHISALHKLEVNELFYLFGHKIIIKEITDINGKQINVLCVGD